MAKPMTWGELKDKIDNEVGISDDTPIFYLDLEDVERVEDVTVVLEPQGLVVV